VRKHIPWSFFSDYFQWTIYGIQLRKLKNIHKGSRCFIVGNGPSLTAEDLTKLYQLGEVTFAMNRIYHIFDKTLWKPTYYCCEDPLIIKEKQKEINEIKCSYKFIPINLKWYHGVNINKPYYYFSNYKRDRDGIHPVSTDISRQINCRGTVTFTCIQIAIYMGFKEI
jgi:hypothetical protein